MTSRIALIVVFTAAVAGAASFRLDGAKTQEANKVQTIEKEAVVKTATLRATAATSIGKVSDANTRKALTDLMAYVDAVFVPIAYAGTNTVATKVKATQPKPHGRK